MEGNLSLCSRKLHTTDLRLKQDILLEMEYLDHTTSLQAVSLSTSPNGTSINPQMGSESQWVWLMQIHLVDCNSLCILDPAKQFCWWGNCRVPLSVLSSSSSEPTETLSYPEYEPWFCRARGTRESSNCPHRNELSVQDGLMLWSSHVVVRYAGKTLWRTPYSFPLSSTSSKALAKLETTIFHHTKQANHCSLFNWLHTAKKKLLC